LSIPIEEMIGGWPLKSLDLITKDFFIRGLNMITFE
jgi:hypothetical protein